MHNIIQKSGRHAHDRMLVGFATNYAINAYRHEYWEFEPRLW